MVRYGSILARRSLLCVGLALGWVGAKTSRAQETLAADGGARSFLGVGAALAIPQGEFDAYIDASPGIGGFLVWNFDERGRFGLRLDGSVVFYGEERARYPLSPTVRRVWVEVTTRNHIISLILGPQIAFPLGPFRPYLNTGAGFSYFATTSSVRGSDNWESFARSTNFDDFTLAWSGGGGLWIDISRHFQLLFSTQYMHNGRVRYLREGSIQEAADGTIRFWPIESMANLLLFQVGVSFSLSSATDTGTDE